MSRVGIMCILQNNQYGMYEFKKTKQIVNKTSDRTVTYFQYQ